MDRTWAGFRHGVSALGLVAGLIAVGYLVDTSYHALLGIEVYEIDPKGYVLAAGRFLSDSIVLVLNRGVPSLWSWAGVIVALAAVGVGFKRRRAISAGLLLAAALGSVLLYGSPALKLEYRLTPKGQTPPEDVTMGYLKAGGFPARRSEQLAKLLVCAHAPSRQDKWKESCEGFPVQSTRGVEDWYVAELALAGALIVALWLTAESGTDGLTEWLRNATSLLVLLAVLLAPISYGRLLRVDQTSSVIVFMTGGTWQCKDGSNPDCTVNGILLAESSGAIVIFCTNDNLIWQLGKEHVAYVQQLGPVRVLDAIIQTGR
jgi:hypothetical protein